MAEVNNILSDPNREIDYGVTGRDVKPHKKEEAKTQETTVSDLEKKVNEAEARLRRFIEFSGDIASKLGTRLKYETHFYHIKAEYDLKDFFGFDIYNRGSFSDFGGEKVKISHGGVAVLDVDDWGQGGTQKIHVYRHGLWEEQYEDMIKNKDKFISEYKQKIELAKQEAQRRHEDAAKQAELLERAKRLKID